MRFLNTRTGLFTTVDNPESTPYAILSHVWAKPDGEQSYDDVQIIQDGVLADRMTNPHLPETEVLIRLSPKIRNACERASADNLELIWIDTCCINKSSSAELSEAINSMYAWYGTAITCYAYLADVPGGDSPQSEGPAFPIADGSRVGGHSRSSSRQTTWFSSPPTGRLLGQSTNSPIYL